MKALIVAAGYGSRMMPLTAETPKALLPIAGKPLLDHVMAWIESVPEITEIVLVSNQHYLEKFSEWEQGYQTDIPITILNDGSTANENRLGTIRDIQFAYNNAELHDHVLVISSDNIYPFQLTPMVDLYFEKERTVVAGHRVESEEVLKRGGVGEVDADGRLISLEEKPQSPKGDISVPMLYIFPKGIEARLEEYLAAEDRSDAPGFFISWLCEREEIYVYHYDGRRYAIDDPETYERVNQELSQLLRPAVRRDQQLSP